MESRVFKIEEEHRPKAALTISTDACLGGPGKVHFFSLGSYTDISPERYDCPALYIGAGGQADFVLGGGREQDVRKKATGCARGNEPFCPACLEKGGGIVRSGRNALRNESPGNGLCIYRNFNGKGDENERNFKTGRGILPEGSD